MRLPGGHLLATFHGRGASNIPPGGLVELDREGRLVRATSARAPAIDRVVSTSTDILADFGAHLQITMHPWTANGQDHEAGPGDILVVKAGEIHSFLSIGDVPLKQLDIHLGS